MAGLFFFAFAAVIFLRFFFTAFHRWILSEKCLRWKYENSQAQNNQKDF
ncbi:hypothetical protein [Kaistella haifensis]|nr:hypothetical protein [Kaistella haifensis]